MRVQVNGFTQQAAVTTLSLRCPFCREIGILEQVGLPHDSQNQEGVRFGPRRCPKPECHALVFVVHNGAQVLHAYPPSRLDFDSTNIPAAVAKAMEETVVCHAAECFIASAIMVRNRKRWTPAADLGVGPTMVSSIARQMSMHA